MSNTSLTKHHDFAIWHSIDYVPQDDPDHYGHGHRVELAITIPVIDDKWSVARAEHADIDAWLREFVYGRDLGETMRSAMSTAPPALLHRLGEAFAALDTHVAVIELRIDGDHTYSLNIEHGTGEIG